MALVARAGAHGSAWTRALGRAGANGVRAGDVQQRGGEEKREAVASPSLQRRGSARLGGAFGEEDVDASSARRRRGGRGDGRGRGPVRRRPWHGDDGEAAGRRRQPSGAGVLTKAAESRGDATGTARHRRGSGGGGGNRSRPDKEASWSVEHVGEEMRRSGGEVQRWRGLRVAVVAHGDDERVRSGGWLRRRRSVEARRRASSKGRRCPPI